VDDAVGGNVSWEGWLEGGGRGEDLALEIEWMRHLRGAGRRRGGEGGGMEGMGWREEIGVGGERTYKVWFVCRGIL
jgi:hypothetical protein